MSKELEETLLDNPNNLTKEELLSTIKDVFRDNEEALKYINSIVNNLLEIKKLEIANPKSTSFMWLLPVMMLFGNNFNYSKDPIINKEDEANKSELSDN